jgi:uncharacterized protein
MDYYFFDSSSIVKNYVQEVGTNWVKVIFNSLQTTTIYSVEISEVEVVAAFARKLKGNKLTQLDANVATNQFKVDFLKDFRIVEVDKILLKSAVQIAEKHSLRGYDAVQLASALEVENELTSLNLPSLIFVSADNELNNSAKSEGLTVENPNDYY